MSPGAILSPPYPPDPSTRSDSPALVGRGRIRPEGRIRCMRGTAREGRPDYLLGWGVTRRYGLRALNPFGNRSVASSSDSAGTTITSSPSFQFTGVATL